MRTPLAAAASNAFSIWEKVVVEGSGSESPLLDPLSPNTPKSLQDPQSFGRFLNAWIGRGSQNKAQCSLLVEGLARPRQVRWRRRLFRR